MVCKSLVSKSTVAIQHWPIRTIKNDITSIVIGHLQIFKFCSLTNDLQTTVFMTSSPAPQPQKHKLWEKIQLHVWTLLIPILIRFKVIRFSTCKQAMDVSANRFQLVYQVANNCCITVTGNQTAETKLFIPPNKDFGASNATQTSFTELRLCSLVVSHLYPAFPWSYISCFLCYQSLNIHVKL